MNRVKDPADPERCQGKADDGQCMNRAEVGSEYCMVHNGGFSMAQVIDRRLYLLTEVRNRDRLALLSESDPVYALREAIALARMLVNKRFNLAQEQPDLFRDHGIINTLQLTVERLVKSATLIEHNLTALKGKSEVLRLGQLIIQVISEELQGIKGYDDTFKRICDRTVHAIASANNHSEVQTTPMPAIPPRGWRPAEGETLFQIDNADDKFRLAHLAKHERIKSLTEDIGLQVILIEQLWNSARTPIELVSVAPVLNESLRTLNKLITSAHSIEETLGNLLNRETLRNIGQELSRILVEELEHIEGFEQIVDHIYERVERGFEPVQKRLSA